MTNKPFTTEALRTGTPFPGLNITVCHKGACDGGKTPCDYPNENGST